MSSRLQQHARTRLNFAGDMTAKQRLAACKTFLRLEGAMIRMLHEGGGDGLAVAQARAAMIDGLLTHLFDHATRSFEHLHGKLPAPVSLVALGGYGRRELCPLSDIDIMFLFPGKLRAGAIKPLQEALTQDILYTLWDCGLKVGHSTRTVEEALAESKRDIQTKTALIEARLIAGSTVLFETFESTFRAFYTANDPRSYIEARLLDQTERRKRYADTVFLQEPDVKNGVGGLRDYQNALWMARVKLGITEMAELAAQNYLRKNELRDFQRAYNFLLRVRNELHYLSKRPTDLLDLATQPQLALNLGYANQDMLARVEKFMHDYYKAAHNINRITKVVENRLSLTLGEPQGALGTFREMLRAGRQDRTKHIDGFVLRGRELAAENESVFHEDPIRIIRVFRHCQQLDRTPDFALQSLIRDSLPLITRKVTHSVDANLSFRSILDEVGGVFPTLNLMHELGVLGRFIPEFAALTCLVQHEFYHRYTADVHTLNAIRELDQIFAATELIAQKYRSELRETESPSLLYLILLLHDIGKAHGIQGHSESGVKIAIPLLERLQVDPESREVVLFVIKNHLIMARFWQTRDVDDPKTAAAFAEMVDDAEKLRYLYVHTFCDARGTAASLWNSYKDTLHTTLFRATLERLTLGEAIDARHLERKQMIQQELIQKTIPGISTDEITAHFNLLPERYFIHTDAGEIALHIQMVNRLLRSITETDSVGTLTPVIDWKDDLNRSLTVVNVITWDRAGLFYKLAGAFSVAGLNILGAKVLSRADHIAIDTFYVVEPGRGVVQSQSAMNTFARTVEAALVQSKDLYPEIVTQAKKLSANRIGKPDSSPLNNSFPPTVEVYHELSMQRTIVEIQAPDQIGLLYRLAKVIYDHGFDITFARIGTERGVAIDTFYIESADHHATDGTGRLHALRDELMKIISSAAPSAEVAAV